MHRVELKEEGGWELFIRFSGFLMHRVELKAEKLQVHLVLNRFCS